MAIDIDYSQFEPAFKKEEAAPAETVTPEIKDDVVAVTEAVTTKEVAPPVETPPAEKVQTDYISSLNTKFNTSFKSDDDLKAIIESASKAQALQEQLKEFETLKADIDYYKSGVNPLDYFASEDDYRMQQFKKTNPDKDAGVANKLFTTDLDKLSDVDVLAQYELLHGTFQDGEVGAKELVASTYEIDLDDPESWTRLSKNTMARAANKARSEIKELKGSIKLPDKIDLASKREAEKASLQQKADLLKKGWGDVVPKMLTDLKEVVINDTDKDGKEEPLMKYVIDEDAKKELGAEVMEYLVSTNKDITEDNVKEAAIGIQREYVLRNLPKILKAYATTLVAEVDRKKDEETHNPVPLKTETKSVSDSEAAKQREIDYAIGGVGWKGKPLIS